MWICNLPASLWWQSCASEQIALSPFQEPSGPSHFNPLQLKSYFALKQSSRSRWLESSLLKASLSEWESCMLCADAELPSQSWAFSVLNFSLEMFIVLLTMQSTNFRWRKRGNHTALSPSWFCLAPGCQFKSYSCCFVTILLLPHFLHCNSHHIN